MYLFTSILGALALAGAALAQDPGATQISFFTGPTCAGAATGIERGFLCNNCYTFDQAWGALNMDSGFPDDSIWYAWPNDNCGISQSSFGFRRGLGCFGGGELPSYCCTNWRG
ncbi:hypothetical protein DFH09DRAFT_1289962 [Mycena vulgaris]|nr:hypothetical protein DFH09DRAFT_1289962 [Mycena vulgaris]